MKRRISVFTTMALTVGLFPAAFAQQGQQAQPTDPTAQAPATPPQSTPPTFPETKNRREGQQSADSSASIQRKVRPFMGTIVSRKDTYMLRAGDLEYKLDDQAKAKDYQGKNVKIQGSLDKQTNTIHVQTIEESPSM